MTTSYAYGGDPPGLVGKYHWGVGSVGVLGSAAPATGAQGPGFWYERLNLPADNDVEFYGAIPSLPGGVAVDADEAGGFTATGPDGTFVIPYNFYRMGQAQAGLYTFSLQFGAAAVTLNLTGAAQSGGGVQPGAAVQVVPQAPGVINLAGSSQAGGAVQGVGAVSVTPGAGGVINLAGSSQLGAPTNGVGAISVMHVVPGIINLGGSSQLGAPSQPDVAISVTRPVLHVDDDQLYTVRKTRRIWRFTP